MHIDELHRRITSHAGDTVQTMLTRILHPGHVFCTVNNDGHVTVWAVSSDGEPLPLPDER